MKILFMWVGCLALMAPLACGQGTFHFSNRVSAIGLDAPAYDATGLYRLTDAFAGQLYVGLTSDALMPVGEPLRLLNGYFSAYVYSESSGNPGISSLRVAPGIPPGAEAWVEVRIWHTQAGSSYEAAAPYPDYRGRSNLLKLVAGGDTLGGTTPPTLPAFLVGLQPVRLEGFALPEPRSITLVVTSLIIIVALGWRPPEK